MNPILQRLRILELTHAKAPNREAQWKVATEIVRLLQHWCKTNGVRANSWIDAGGYVCCDTLP